MPSNERTSSTWDLTPDTTLPRLLAANARELPQDVAFREKDRGIWQETTWQTAFDKTLRCAAGLQALGLQKGHAMLILGDNRPHVLPLLLPLPGLLRLRMFTYRWVALFVWLYFIEGVVRAAGDGGLSARLAGVEVLLVLVLFAACTAHVRLRQQVAKTASRAPV